MDAGPKTVTPEAGPGKRLPPPVRYAQLDPALTDGHAWQPGGQFRLDLLENQDLTVTVESVEATATGGRVIRGRATSDGASSVTLTHEGTSLTGYVRLSGLGAFRLAPVGTGEVLEVRQVDIRAQTFCGTVPQPVPVMEGALGRARAGVARSADALPAADTLPEPTVVEVMFLYTPQAVIGEGNEEGIRRRVLESVEETNYRLTNSLINVRVEPVYIGLYNTFESGDLPRDTYRLATGGDGMERVPQLRHDYQADLVCLITELENQGIGGQAFDHTPPRGNPATGFTVIRRMYMGRGIMVLAHELGHLFGCAHDREHAGEVDSEFYQAREPYIFGHRLVVEGVTYTDVMSYEPGINVPYFSNPRLYLDGVPLGVPADQTRPSDGARTINETAPYVAQYRTARSRIEFAQARVVVAEQTGTATVRLVRTGDLDTSTRVNVLFDSASSAKVNFDYTRPAITVVDFSTNQATSEIVIPILADDLVEGEESIRLHLIAVQGDHGIGGERMCEVVILDASTPPAFSQVAFPEGPLAVIESAGQARVQVRLVDAGIDDPAEPVELPYRTMDGTAVTGSDYQAVSGTLTHTAGVTEWEIRVPLMDRPEAGPDRAFSLIVGTRTNVVRILDEQRLGALRGNPGRDLAPDGNLNAKVRGDGKLLVWGNFSRLSGQERTGIALLNPDGTLDDSFRPPEILLGHRRMERLGFSSANAAIAAVEAQPDGKLVLAGNFSRINGQPRSTVVRLHPDGSVDDTFGGDLSFDGAIYSLVIDRDGRCVVGGKFEHINGVRRPFIARLLPDGMVDESFQPDGGPTSDWAVNILTVALQADGKILMGGFFHRVDGVPMLNLARLNLDGTFDSTFKLRTGALGPIWRIRVQPDGRIVVGGVFDVIGGRTARKLARLNPDGSPDLTFRPPQPNADVNNIVCLPDGRLLISGGFTTLAGKERRFLTLLNPDGTLDDRLDPGSGPDRFLGSEATPILADGTLYLAGPFQHYNGVVAPSLVRLHLGELQPSLRRTHISDGQLGMTVHGFAGGRYSVESSADFQQWEPAGEVHLQAYDQQAEFTAPIGGGDRFFRLMSPNP